MPRDFGGSEAGEEAGELRVRRSVCHGSIEDGVAGVEVGEP